MKKIKKELDVDVIGTQNETITKEEKNLISDYISSYKIKRTKKSSNSKVNI